MLSRNVTVKDTNNGKVIVIYSAKDVISALKTPIVKDVKVLIFCIYNKYIIVLVTHEWVDTPYTNIILILTSYANQKPEPPAILEDNRPPSSWPSKGRIEF